LAAGIEELLAAGHGQEVWTYTPRRIAAFLALVGRRTARSALADLSVARLAAHAEGKDYSEQVKTLEALADGRPPPVRIKPGEDAVPRVDPALHDAAMAALREVDGGGSRTTD
jgi:hypothetical protein